MVTIQLEFLAGRYHATPWGRHVNEGVAEWPPSPYRIARSLVDVWKRRFPDWPVARILPVFQAFCRPPTYFLPPVSSGHTRSFLHSNLIDASKRQKIIDSFMVVPRTTPLFLGFAAELQSSSLEDLANLLSQLNYLGRSESWVRASLSAAPPPVAWNCLPADDPHAAGELVPVACLAGTHNWGNSESWLDDLCRTTRNLLKEGWNIPPALQWINYRRPVEREVTPLPVGNHRQAYCAACYAIVSPVRLPVTETVAVAERVRAYLMGIHRRLMDDDPARVSGCFSGKDRNSRPLADNHQHAFFLPVDEDGDGYLDHIRVFSLQPFSRDELDALDRLNRIWHPKRREGINLVLLGFTEQPFNEQASTWGSATPYVTARHYRRGRGSYDEWLVADIRLECRFHGLPEPENIQLVAASPHISRTLRWPAFIRERKGRRPGRGHGAILTFNRPVNGPFTLGSGCHFGLGLFRPLCEP